MPKTTRTPGEVMARKAIRRHGWRMLKRRPAQSTHTIYFHIERPWRPHYASAKDHDAKERRTLRVSDHPDRAKVRLYPTLTVHPHETDPTPELEEFLA